MYNKIFTTKTHRVIYLIVLIFLVLTTATHIIFSQRQLLGGTLEINAFSYTFGFSQLLIMFLAGLWGIVPAVVAFIIAFIDAAIYDIDSAYSVSIYLIALAGAYFLSNRKAYRHVWSTILGGVILNAVMGGVWSAVGTIAAGEGLGGIDWTSVVADQIYVATECTIYCVTMFLFMHLAPTRIKRAFPMGVDYIEGDDLKGDIRDYRFVHNSRISRKLSYIVIAQALLLGIFAATFAAQLMPSIADEVLSDTATDMESFFRLNKKSQKPSDAPAVPEGDAGSTDSSDSVASGTGQIRTEKMQDQIEHQRFVLNNAGASFVIKLILMILNISLPLIELEIAAVQWMVARPITSMAKTLRDFSEAKEDEQEEKLRAIEAVHLHGNDEIVDLYRSISDMAHRITSFVDQKLREAELEEEVRVAQKASESKSNFLNNVSHELRTPINAVLGLDEMIVRETSEEHIRDYANDIQSAGKSLLSLVNDILDSSKLEEGKMEILPVEYELGSVINDIVNMIALKARDKNLKFDLDVDEHLPHILYGDEIRIKQVIVNILTNAVKYTEEGGFTMKLSFRKVSGDEIMLFCSVSDTGIGIKEEDMKKLFSRFERIEESRNRSIEGTGLGMNIVQQLLGLMDSELHVESVYGEGSTFSFEVRQKVVSWDEMGDFVESYRRSLESTGEYKERFTAPEAHILVTDDTPMNLTVIKGLLKPTLIQIDTATSGFETLDMICEKKYDVIFLDHRMPEMDGVETLQKMREKEGSKNGDTPVISLTANAVSGARETYLSAGFVDYISKPIDSSKLEKMLMHYLPDEKICMVEETEVTAPAGDGAVDLRPEVSEPVSASSKPVSIADPKLMEFSEIPGIDYGEAIKNCANEDVLLEAARDYTADIMKKAELIEEYRHNGDFENYTVLVHALKSSSRLIGAMSLSEEARHLEDCGNRARQGDERAMREIDRRTPMMIELYRGYYECLAPVFGMETMGAGEDERPEIPAEKLTEGMMCLRDLTEAFDFDSMECVLGMLEEYRMPESFAPHYEAIKTQIHNVDQAALLSEIDSCLSS